MHEASIAAVSSENDSSELSLSRWVKSLLSESMLCPKPPRLQFTDELWLISLSSDSIPLSSSS